MRFVRRLLVGIVGVVVVLAVIGFLLPREVVVARAVTVGAPPSMVFPYVASPRRLAEWSPWQAMDPAMKQVFEGPEQGVGAKMTWDSANPQVGAGSQEIVAVEQDARVDYRLSFGGMPDAAVSFILVPDGAGTRVEWRMRADMGMNPVGRWFGLMMDRWVGADFDRGLAALRSKAGGG